MVRLANGGKGIGYSCSVGPASAMPDVRDLIGDVADQLWESVETNLASGPS